MGKPLLGASLQANFTCEMGTTWTYTPTSVLPWTGNIHGAYMANLIPGAQYEYYVGDPYLLDFSNTTTFLCPDFQNPDKDIFVALGGDMGTIQLFGYKVAEQMHHDYRQQKANGQRAFDAFWLIGDIAYSTLDPPKWNFEFFWDMFFRQEQSLAQHIPMLASFGNHDFSGGHAGAYVNRFRLPDRNIPGGGLTGLGNFYWSYEHGPVKYISICTEIGLEPHLCNYAPGSAQYRWLTSQLQTVNRSRTPWVIVAGHRPMYSSDKATDSGPLQRYLESLLLQFNVDVELAGHMHCTELSAPVANNVANMTGVQQNSPSSWTYTNPGAPVHITAGTLGALIRESFHSPAPSWSMFRNGTFWDNAYGYVTMHGTRSQLKFTFLKTSPAGEVMWDVTVRKE